MCVIGRGVERGKGGGGGHGELTVSEKIIMLYL